MALPREHAWNADSQALALEIDLQQVWTGHFEQTLLGIQAQTGFISFSLSKKTLGKMSD